jgi:hypothetical protein
VEANDQSSLIEIASDNILHGNYDQHLHAQPDKESHQCMTWSRLRHSEPILSICRNCFHFF